MDEKKPLNIEQAGNILKAKKETLSEDIKKEASQHPISVAVEEDRKKFLMYALSFLRNITEGTKCAFCALTNKPPALYTTSEVVEYLRKILILRIHGYSIEVIAKHVKETPDTIKDIETLAVRIVQDAITTSRASGIPLVGGIG